MNAKRASGSAANDTIDPVASLVATAPMEALAAAELPEEPGTWQYEPKWDGFRCLAFRSGDLVELMAKSGKPLARYFPEVVAFLKDVPVQRFALDGELVFPVDGRLSFDALQMRLHPSETRIHRLSRETPARFILFDILDDGSGRLIEEPLAQRRRALEAFAEKYVGDEVMLSPVTRDPAFAAQWLKQSGEGPIDGVVAKRR